MDGYFPTTFVWLILMHWRYAGILGASFAPVTTFTGCGINSIATLFGCPVMPFECAPFCNGAQKVDEGLRYSPLFAVAMGLALREVMP